MIEKDLKVCNRCVMDTSDPKIIFDADGVCNHCTDALMRLEKQLFKSDTERQKSLNNLIKVIKKEGEGKQYDCLIGLSGGVDSTTVAYEVVRLGLRPLVLHIDNTWNTKIANDNIKNTVTSLGLEMTVFKIDEEEFLDLQLSFIKSSLANCEAPTDHAITATLFRVAQENDIRFILSGSNLTSEVIMPVSWGHYNQDLKLLKAIHQKFGTKSMDSIPTISLTQYFSYVFKNRIRQIPLLNYFNYDKEVYKNIIAKELGWISYGGKHHESIWTRFFQSYYLIEKFGFDKRKAHYSSLICSSQLTREKALKLLKEYPIDPEVLEEDKKHIKKKFRITDEDFITYMNERPKEAKDYPNHLFLFEKLNRFKNVFRKIATSVK